MFLITPKSTHSSVIQNNRDHVNEQAASARIIRAHKACDRCRLKKIKCNGEKPCVRCAHDNVGCTLSMRRPNDPKESLRDYIASLESRQTRLIHALQRMCRNVGRPIEEKDTKDILEVLKACGYAADGVQSMEFDSDAMNTGSPRRVGRQLKRMRSKDLGERHNIGISSKITKTSNVLDVGNESLATENCLSSKQDETTTRDSGTIYSDDYWDLDAYWNQVTYSQLLKETVDQSQAPMTFSSMESPLPDEFLLEDWPSDMANWDVANVSGTIDQDVTLDLST